MIIDIISGFPEIFTGLINSSILRGAMLEGKVDVWVHDLRHYTTDRHGKIDDSPYGGGAGMVLMAQPIFACLDALRSLRNDVPTLIFMSPQGERLHQPLVRELSTSRWAIILCGHYKDIDARIFQRDEWRELSLGDYILSGGELAAAVLVDSMVRLLPGVLGNEDSAAGDSFEQGLLDAPYYTKPEEIAGLRVPDELLSGHHANIDRWRLGQKLQRTLERRPDLPGVLKQK